MADLAELELRIRSVEVAQATKNLDEMAAASKRAESGTKGLEKGTKGLAQATDNQTKTVTKNTTATQAQLRNLDLVGKLARTAGLNIGVADKTVAAVTRSFGGMSVALSAVGVGLLGVAGGLIGSFVSSLLETEEAAKKATSEVGNLALALTAAGSSMERTQQIFGSVGKGTFARFFGDFGLDEDQGAIVRKSLGSVFQAFEAFQTAPDTGEGLAFKLLGIDPKNADGSFRKTSDVLRELAFVINDPVFITKPGAIGAVERLLGSNAPEFVGLVQTEFLHLTRALDELRGTFGDKAFQVEPQLPVDFTFFSEIEKKREEDRVAQKKWADDILKEYQALDKEAAESAKKRLDEVNKTLQDAAKITSDWEGEIEKLEISTLTTEVDQINKAYDIQIGKIQKLKEQYGAFIPAIDRFLVLLEKQRGIDLNKANEGGLKPLPTLSPGALIIADLEEELSLLKMTNEEREVAIVLRGEEAGVTASQREEIEGLVNELERIQSLKDVADDVGRAFSDAFGAIIFGAGSAKDAALDMVMAISQAIFQEFVAKKITSSISSAFSSLFSGGGAPGGLPGPTTIPGAGGGTVLAKGGMYWGGELQSFAKGGMLVTKPTLFATGGVPALVGEGLKNEGIFPLENSGSGNPRVQGFMNSGGRLEKTAFDVSRMPNGDLGIIVNPMRDRLKKFAAGGLFDFGGNSSAGPGLGSDPVTSGTNKAEVPSRVANINFTVSTPNPDAFRSSEQQLIANARRKARLRR